METLSESTIKVLNETEHLFWENQDQITHRMYEIMFDKYPETKSLFNKFRKHQPNIFGAAMMCHLVSKEEPEVLESFRVGICRSHVKAGVQEEHYAMMAESLFIAMEEILKEKATEEMINAWKTWYYFIANLLIEREREHYQEKRLLYPKEANIV